MDGMDADALDYSAEHEVQVIEEYGDEVLEAEWNPQLALLGDGPIAQFNRHIDLLTDFACVDMDGFLKEVYEHQC